MDQLPAVAIAATPDAASHVVRVSLGDRIRHFEVAAERLKDRLVAVLISEFGLAQSDAHAHADEQIASAQANADVESIRAEKAADYDRMVGQLAAVQKQLAEAESEMDRLRTHNAELHAQIEQLTAPPPAEPDEQPQQPPAAD